MLIGSWLEGQKKLKGRDFLNKNLFLDPSLDSFY